MIVPFRIAAQQMVATAHGDAVTPTHHHWWATNTRTFLTCA